MERIVGVVDAVGHFAPSFCDYVNDKRLFPYPTMAYTDPTQFLANTGNMEVMLLLIGEEFSYMREELPECPILWLTEHTTDAQRNLVSRYQGADHLLKEMIARLGDNLVRSDAGVVLTTAVYSPASCQYQTTLALAYAHMSSDKRRVLYLNLEDYAGLDELFDEQGKDLSELLYHYLGESPDKQARILSSIEKLDRFDAIGPSRCPEDLYELTGEMLVEFLEYLKGLSIYDEIVVDVGHLVHAPWVLLHHCDQVLVPVRSMDAVGQSKREHFYEFLDRSCYAGIRQRMKEIAMPQLGALQGMPITSQNMLSMELESKLREVLGA